MAGGWLTGIVVGALLGLLVGAFLWWRKPRIPQIVPQVGFDIPPKAVRVDVHGFDVLPLFLAVVNTLDVGILLASNDGRILFLNPLAAELFGVAERQVQGAGLMTLLRDHQADALVREVLDDGETREMTLRPVMSGRTLQLRCSSFVHDETHHHALLLIRDVTHITMLERARRDLVANVSHELRTPLASLKLLVETLQSEPPPAIAQRMLGQAAHEVDAVTQLVDELHDLSQIESGRVTLKLTPTMVAPVIEQAMNRMRPQADRKQLALGAEFAADLPAVLIDEDRVGQVLLNLLHNAVKFTAAHGTIGIRVHSAFVADTQPREALIGTAAARRTLPLPIEHPPGLWMFICIQDTGIGIPAEDVPRIFERFYKVDRARTRNAGGTGLGLAIARHLIEGHGGRLWADSIEGQGSSFFFTLPVA